MITEDELRDRLHSESAGLLPRGDLLESVAAGHARRHRRTRAGLISGSIAATALVAVVLAGLFTSGPALQVDSAAPSDSEIIKRAQEAVAATRSMISHMKATYTGGEKGGRDFETWVLRSENLGRMVFNQPFASDTVVKPDGRESISAEGRMALTTPQTIDDVSDHVNQSGVGDFASLVKDPSLRVHRDQSGIHLVATPDSIQMDVGIEARNTNNLQVDILIDSKTYLPKAATFVQMRMSYEWLPATAENRKLLEHTVPPGYTRETMYPPAVPPTK